MEKSLARQLLPLVNDPEAMRLLNIYIDWKIEQTRNELEHAIEVARISELQGRVRELRRMKELRELTHGWMKNGD